MSTYRDVKAPVQFYFGNALKDLSHLLPEDEEATPQNTNYENIHAQIHEIEALLNELETTQNHLSFLLREVDYFLKS
jgi:hypothetical protein